MLSYVLIFVKKKSVQAASIGRLKIENQRGCDGGELTRDVAAAAGAMGVHHSRGGKVEERNSDPVVTDVLK